MAEKKEGELAEVERALSVLAGRDPKALSAEREAKEAATRKRDAIDAASRSSRRRTLRAAFVWGLVALAGLLFLGVLALLRARAAAAEAALSEASAPYAAAGFARAEPGFFSLAREAELDVPEDSCVLAVPARGTRSVRLEAPGADPTTAQGTILHCTCAAEHVRATAAAGPGAGAVALLRADASAVGGRVGGAFLDPKPQAIAAGGEACEAEHLDAWVAAGRYPKSPPAALWTAGALAALAGHGFASVARLPADRTYAVLSAAEGRCFVAAGEGGEVALHQGGAARARGPRVAWCAAKLGAALLERVSGSGPVDVVGAPARRVGGPLGLSRVLLAAGLPAEPWVPPPDRAAMAAEALHASLVTDTALVPDGPIQASASASARVVALSVGAPALEESNSARSYEPDAKAAVFFLCAPALAAGVHDTLCVQNGAQTWHAPGVDVPAGAAFGALPAWMSAWAGVRDPDVVRLELDALGLALRLAARGYEATIIEGVTEEDSAVSILGRSGDDGVVALGVWPAPPWVEPYGEPAWSLDGEPTVVPLTGGARVRLPGRDRTAAPPSARRTVVFRRAAKEIP